MNLKDITDFISSNKDMFNQLKDPAITIVDDVKSLFVKNSYNQAAKFVAALNDNISAEGGADRLAALNAAIDGLNVKRSATDDDLIQADLNDRIGNLEQLKANVEVAAAFNSVVAFTDDDKTSIANLLTRAGSDIDNRKTLKTAIDITVNLIELAATLAGKAATFGI